MACRQKGLAILSVRVVVSGDGEPVFWTEPEMLKLEPISHSEQIIAIMLDK